MGECQSGGCCVGEGGKRQMEIDGLTQKTNPGLSSKAKNDARMADGGPAGQDGYRTIKFENGSVYHGESKHRLDMELLFK